MWSKYGIFVYLFTHFKHVDYFAVHVYFGSGEVSGTGAAPYMALKSSIYGTKFSIWHYILPYMALIY
jgi:hypothetical protein